MRGPLRIRLVLLTWAAMLAVSACNSRSDRGSSEGTATTSTTFPGTATTAVAQGSGLTIEPSTAAPGEEVVTVYNDGAMHGVAYDLIAAGETEAGWVLIGDGGQGLEDPGYPNAGTTFVVGADEIEVDSLGLLSGTENRIIVPQVPPGDYELCEWEGTLCVSLTITE